jgi:hypothetical protein
LPILDYEFLEGIIDKFSKFELNPLSMALIGKNKKYVNVGTTKKVYTKILLPVS